MSPKFNYKLEARKLKTAGGNSRNGLGDQVTPSGVLKHRRSQQLSRISIDKNATQS
jgi:hypothetical protein